MKILAILLVIVLVLAIIWIVMEVSRNGSDGVLNLFKRHQQQRAKWTVEPRGGLNESSQIWLVRGEDEFFFWPNENTEHLHFDMALLEAEIQAGEFNRVRKAVGG